MLQMIDNHPLAEFAVIYQQPIEWGDMDAFGHVNNVEYYRYAQSARIDYLQRLDMFNEKSYTVLAQSSCQYLRPVVFPDTLWIGIRAKKVGNTSLTHEYVYFSEKQQAVVAILESVIVFFDEKGENKTPISDDEREKIRQLEATKR